MQVRVLRGITSVSRRTWISRINSAAVFVTFSVLRCYFRQYNLGKWWLSNLVDFPRLVKLIYRQRTMGWIEKAQRQIKQTHSEEYICC